MSDQASSGFTIARFAVKPWGMNRTLQLLVPFLGAFALAGVAATAAEHTVGTGASFKGPVGLQLYSLRADFAKDVPGTLKRVRELGFKYVELAGTYNLSPEKFKEALDANGLVPIAGHFPYERYRDDVEGIARDAKALGLQYAGCAWIAHQGDFDEKTCRQAIEVFNRAGEALARHNIKFYYHTHGYEFQPFGNGTLFDLLMAETKPKFVNYQMDILWIVHPGQDPVALLQKYGKRFELMHVKDLKKGIKGDLTGHTDVTNDVTLGTGQMDLAAILKAAKKANVKWYFVEDESPTSAEQIPQSLKYLEQLKF
jgi:sugar phosphate isomerase/epimerase